MKSQQRPTSGNVILFRQQFLRFFILDHRFDRAKIFSLRFRQKFDEDIQLGFDIGGDETENGSHQR